jgi:hypothetical protein
MRNLNARLRSIRRRLGAREDMIAAIALAVIAVSGLSFTLITHTGTPAGAALAYMAAVDRADTDYVWSHSIVDVLNGSAPNTTLLDRAALDAQLRATAHTRSAIGVQGISYASGGTKVVLTYNTSSGPVRTSLIMRGGAPHSWPVLVDPAGLDIALPPGAGAIAIDGRTLETNGDELKLAVFPGSHQLSVAGSDLYQPFTEDVDVATAFPMLTPATFTKIQPTDKAVSQAKQAVTSAIQNCATSSALVPAGCPQAYTADVSDHATWSVLGDQSAGSKLRVNAKGQLELTGHYLMKLSYTSKTRGPRLLAVGGPFTAELNWDGQTLSVSGFSNTSPAATALQRPPATDADVLSPLKAQFNRCLRLQAGSAADCPQSVAAFYASNFVWRATADPTQSATVAWDDVQGFFKVTGTYDFSVDYNSTPPLSPTRHYQDHSSGQYIADLFWDGAKAEFVGFEK